MKEMPDVVHDVVLLTFMRPVDSEGMRAYGTATLVDGQWVDVPVEQVLRRLGSVNGQLDGAGVELRIQTVIEGGLHRGRRDMTTLAAAVNDTLLAHGVDPALAIALTPAIFGAVAQSVAFEPERPVGPVEIDTLDQLVPGDLVGYVGAAWHVTKVRPRKQTVDLRKGFGKREHTAERVRFDELEWHRMEAVDARC